MSSLSRRFILTSALLLREADRSLEQHPRSFDRRDAVLDFVIGDPLR